jgi:adenosylcobyric acid synthase
LKNISIFGTSSDSGKSTITFALGRALKEMGYSVTPFKAQNVSNNSMVADDNLEVAVSTYFQSMAMSTSSSYHINPVLLKSGSGKWQLVLNGKMQGELKIKEYYNMMDTLKVEVKKAFEYLDDRFDIVIAEGAGSPVELNLMHKDLSNIYIADTFDTKIVLVADIERGGVFASIYGVYNLLPKNLRENVVGVIINKFRGDRSFFDEGITIIEEQFGIPVLGVMPHTPLDIAYEDSYSLVNYSQSSEYKLKVAVIKYPHISNFNDIEPLILDSEVFVEFIDRAIPLDSYNMVILPGTKMTISDLRWLKDVGLFEKIKSYQKRVVGICGGYQMLFDTLIDIDGVENIIGDSESGFGYIDDDIVFKNSKILKKGIYNVFGMECYGFEVHCGVSKKYPLYYQNSRIEGTFLHSIFDNDIYRSDRFNKIDREYQGYSFSKRREEILDNFCKVFKENIDIAKIINKG